MVVPDPFLNFWTMFLKLELSQEDRVKGLKQGMEPPCDRITSGHQTLRSSNCCDLRNPLPKVFLGNGNPRRKFENYQFRPVIPSSRGNTSLEKKPLVGSHPDQPVKPQLDSIPGTLSFKCHFETVLQNFRGYSPVSLSLAPPCTLRFPARSTYLRTTPAEDRPSFSVLFLVNFLNSLEIHGLSPSPSEVPARATDLGSTLS